MAESIKCLDDLIKHVRDGKYAGANEASVKQNCLFRLLQSLGWDIFDTNEVRPEDNVQGRLVDFALRPDGLSSEMFIELKRPGALSAASVEQALSYAHRHGNVPLVLLTDGREWRFYLSMLEANYDQRLACAVDLARDDVDVIERRLLGLLSKRSVSGGHSKAYAKALHGMEGHWQEASQSASSVLAKEMVAAASRAGDNLPLGDALHYVGGKMGLERAKPDARPVPVPSTDGKPRNKGGPIPGALFVRGKTMRFKSARDCYRKFLKTVAGADGSALDRIKDAYVRMRLKPCIHRSQHEISGRDPRHFFQVGGRYVRHHFGQRDLIERMQFAAEALDLKWDKDVVVTWDE